MWNQTTFFPTGSGSHSCCFELNDVGDLVELLAQVMTIELRMIGMMLDGKKTVAMITDQVRLVCIRTFVLCPFNPSDNQQNKSNEPQQVQPTQQERPYLQLHPQLIYRADPTLDHVLEELSIVRKRVFFSRRHHIFHCLCKIVAADTAVSF